MVEYKLVGNFQVGTSSSSFTICVCFDIHMCLSCVLIHVSLFVSLSYKRLADAGGERSISASSSHSFSVSTVRG